MREASEKITITVPPDLYEALTIEAQERDIGVGTLCRHLITKSLKHSLISKLSVRRIVSLLYENRKE